MFRSRQAKTKGSARTQIGIKEVRDNILILQDDSCRSILSTTSLNFELQSEEEQDTLIDSFQSFLNSLTVPVQILIRIRELDIERYLENIQASRSDETEKVYKEQLKHYSDFIRKLIAGNKILSRKFYLVIPYDNKAASDFYLAKEQLLLEQEIIAKGLEKLGMSARQLTGLEILDLFYSFYRPDQAKTQPIVKEIMRQTHEKNLI
ncbi:MAG: TraC family protein [Patescibacteria group bacterium]